MEQIREIPLELIVANPQVLQTFDPESIAGMAASLTTFGQLAPIRVREADGKFYIVVGERRFRATKLAGKKTIAAIIEGTGLSEIEVLERQVVEDVQRVDLAPLERAKAIFRLAEATKGTASQIAGRLGISNATVSRLLALLELPAEIQERVAAGEIPASTAYQLAKVGDAEQQAELAKQVASGGLSRDAVTGVRKAASRVKSESRAASVSRATAVLGAYRSVTVASQSLTLDDFIAMLEECLSKARQSRTKGIALSTFIRMCKDTGHAA